MQSRKDNSRNMGVHALGPPRKHWAKISNATAAQIFQRPRPSLERLSLPSSPFYMPGIRLTNIIIIFLRQKPTLILDIKKKGELPLGKKNY